MLIRNKDDRGTDMYDIVIVGAGPAGANLARIIGRQYKVLLIDKRALEGEKREGGASKCCGGLLAPDAQQMLAELCLALPKDILVNPQIFAVRTIDLTNNIERLYQRNYFNMDRDKFDRWLISLVPTEVDKSFKSLFKSFAEVSDGYEVRYVVKGQEASVRTKAIIGADGAFSRVRSMLGREAKNPQSYIAIQEWFECHEQTPYFTAIFDEEINDFYSWIIPKENYLLLGSALKPKEHTWERFERLKGKLTQMGFRFENKVRTEGAHIYRPRKVSQFFAGRDAIALIGEAAGAISPSSAEGISYALKSSLYLAESLQGGIEGFLDRYERRTKDIRLNLFIKNLKSPAMYHPFIRQLAMKSGLQSISK
jgi:geranylgeranyl reductase